MAIRRADSQRAKLAFNTMSVAFGGTKENRASFWKDLGGG